MRRCILVVGAAGGEDGGMRLPRVVNEGESLHGCMSFCAGFACVRRLVAKIHLPRGEFRLFRFPVVRARVQALRKSGTIESAILDCPIIGGKRKEKREKKGEKRIL